MFYPWASKERLVTYVPCLRQVEETLLSLSPRYLETEDLETVIGWMEAAWRRLMQGGTCLPLGFAMREKQSPC
jgi:hypothetical protein